MAESFVDRMRNGWNAFVKPDEEEKSANAGFFGQTNSFGMRPDRVRRSSSNDRSMIGTIYNRLAVDVAAEKIQHVNLDKEDRFIGARTSGLNYCLTKEANLDQAARQFRQDIAQTLFETGVAAIVPVDTDINPRYSSGYDIKTLRVGEITQWYPKHVKINLYNEHTGRKQEILMPKAMVAIVENPLYAIMNEPNSTLQRLIRKLSQLDSIDEQASSGKLDIIIQLPYVVRSDIKREQAKLRQRDLEQQLAGSKYGVGYVDATEKITQLNRPAENNMLGQIQMLTDQLYNQLGLTKEVFDGTANESVMLNYYNRTTEPILAAISEAMERAFLSRTARTQGQAIRYFRDPFKLVSVATMAEFADKFTRNEVLSSNEVRSIIGVKPSKDARADELRNSNMPGGSAPPPPVILETEGDLQNGT